MCVKLPIGNLNSESYPPHLTNTYTCGVTIASKVYGGCAYIILLRHHIKNRKILVQHNPIYSR